MAGVISNPPRGLYSLAGLRDMGDVPRTLTNQVVSTIDISDFLRLNRESLIPVTGGFSTATFHALLTVPAGELWYLHGYSVDFYQLSAGTTGVARTAYTEESGVHIALGPSQAVTAGAQRRLLQSGCPFYAVPGSRLGVWIEEIAGGGNLAFQGAAIITRLRI